MIKALPVVALACVLAAAPTTSSARGFCAQTLSGTYIVVPSFTLKRGKPFPVVGWVSSANDTIHNAITGSAIASSNGQRIAMTLTQGIASLQGAVGNGTYHYNVRMFSGVAPGSTGSFSRLAMFPTGSSDTGGTLTVVDCAALDSSLP